MLRQLNCSCMAIARHGGAREGDSSRVNDSLVCADGRPKFYRWLVHSSRVWHGRFPTRSNSQGTCLLGSSRSKEPGASVSRLAGEEGEGRGVDHTKLSRGIGS